MTRFFRPVAAALGVGVLTGLVVAGGGSRLAMRLIALVDNREDFGFQTEAGAIVGDVTLEGTLAVLLIGVAQGVLGAFLYLALRRWLPASPVSRTLAFALVVVGLGLTLTINGNEADFEFVDTAVSVLSFAAVLLLYALLVPPLIDRFAPRRTSRSAWGRASVAGVLVLALAFGAIAVQHAFEIADRARLPG